MRARGRFLAALAVGLIVLLVVHWLHKLDIGPVKFLAELDEGFYAQLSQPVPNLKAGAPAVVFMDVNDETVKDALGGAASRTPREILAFLVRLAKQSKAAVIFLDIDLRDRTNDEADGALEAALMLDGPLVLVPHFFSSRTPPICLETAGSTGVPASLMDVAVGKGAPIVRVHSYFEVGFTGAARGVCTAYTYDDARNGGRHSLVAAMEAAVSIALKKDCWKVGQPGCPAPREAQITWYIRDHTESVAVNGAVAFVRKSAILFKPARGGWNGEAPLLESGFLQNAIVIIGASHENSDDRRQAPIGHISGALVHANIAIGLQAVHEHAWLSWFPPLPDVLFVLVAAAVTAFVCRWRIYRRLGKRRLLTTWHKLREAWIELAVSVAIWAGLSLVVFYAAPRLEAWRFGILGGLVSMAIVFLSAIMQIVGDRSYELGAHLLPKARNGIPDPGGTSAGQQSGNESR